MSTTQSHKDLFRISTIAENIALFNSLLVSRAIKPGEALALSGSIHAELRRGKGQDGSAYAGYAQTMALLNHHLPAVHQYVVANWHLSQTGLSTSISTVTKSYSDSLFDDTIAMQVPGGKRVYETDREQVNDDGEMLEVANNEKESGEAGEGGEEDEESEEEDEPADIEELKNEEEKMQESEEWEMGENEVDESEELETEELVYEDIPEGEYYDESDTVIEEDDAMSGEVAGAAEYMNESEYENESMEEEEPPWTND